jgi:V8-like Glu-specific endopeptidase
MKTIKNYSSSLRFGICCVIIVVAHATTMAQIPTIAKKKLLEQIEDELRFRSLESKTSMTQSVIYVKDSVLVLTDSGFRRKYIERKVLPNVGLQKITTDSLIKLKPKGIYYTESRIDWYEIPENNPIRSISNQVACLIDKDKMIQLEDGRYQIIAPTLFDFYNVCTTENFNKQSVAGFCSGFAVSNDKVVTAGHCLGGRSLGDIRIVFGYKMYTADSIQLVFNAEDVFTPTSVVASRNSNADDFAVITVNKPIPPARVASIRNADVVQGEDVYVMGHPCGLPLKVAAGARVVTNNAQKYFTADLDTFGGNSGSPVYDNRHNVVGILVRGARDFKYSYEKNCYESNICMQVGLPGCEGEGVSRTSQFLPFIQPHTP